MQDVAVVAASVGGRLCLRHVQRELLAVGGPELERGAVDEDDGNGEEEELRRHPAA